MSQSPVDADSPTHSPVRARRLSSRRGSMTASDPWGTHANVNLDPSRSILSRLSIVRVPAPDPDDLRRHRRHGSNASVSSISSARSEPAAGRMSFAFSTFSPSASARPVSPSASPRLRPQSPALGRSGALPTSQSKLSPEQLVDLARQSCRPRPSFSNSTAAPVPVSFTPLPDSVYLPFIDRPAEVAALISTPPTAKLFALLEQTFPTAVPSEDTKARTTEDDPAKWTYSGLKHWLTAVDRDVAEDVEWVRKTRACILAHSELIWERIKGALGVPQDLNMDDDDELVRASMTMTPAQHHSYPDVPVFDIDSPVIDAHEHDTAYFPGSSPDVIVEHILASPEPPPPSAPDLGASSSLQEVREEDEDGDADADAPPADDDERAVHGLRFSTSPSSPAALGMLSGGGGDSPNALRGARSIARRSSRDEPYDAMSERGPGHPLFPSSFAHLALAPTLRANNRTMRAQSISAYPPLAAFVSPQTIPSGASMDAGGLGRRLRPEWARGWDSVENQYAVTTTSTSSVGGHD